MGSKKRVPENRKVHRKSGKRTAVKFFVAVALMCLVLVAVLSFTVLFKTKTITVKGDSIYTKEKIIEASGISVGDNMLVSLLFGVEGKIEKNLPYIAEADISRSFDGDVVITVKPAVADRCIEKDGKFVYLSSAGKVLQIADKPLEDGIFISGVPLSSADLGNTVAYADSRAKQLIDQIVKSAVSHKLTVNSVSTDGQFSFVDIVVNGKYRVHMLNDKDVDYKLLHISDSISKIPNGEGGTFTFSDSKNGKTVFKAEDIFAPDIPEEELPEEIPSGNADEEGEKGVENTNS